MLLGGGSSRCSVHPGGECVHANRGRIDIQLTQLLFVVANCPPRTTENVRAGHVGIGIMLKLQMEAEPMHSFQRSEGKRGVNIDHAATPAAHVRIVVQRFVVRSWWRRCRSEWPHRG